LRSLPRSDLTSPSCNLADECLNLANSAVTKIPKNDVLRRVIINAAEKTMVSSNP